MQTTHLTKTHFSDFPIHPKIVDALNESGFKHCTPIQAMTLPPLLEGADVAGQAQTGTGKTLAFLTGLFHHLMTQAAVNSNQPRAIVLAPTRELAIQIHKDAEILNQYCGFKLGLIYGGEGYQSQKDTLSGGIDIIIGTTGRIIDYYKQGIFSLDNVQAVVLDEADRMFDLGFIKDIRYLFRRMPPASERLSMLFSATLSYRVQELAYEHMNSPTHLQVDPEQMTASRIKEELFYPSNEDKMLLLLTLIEEEWPEKAIVFANTKQTCESITSWLEADNHRVGALSGDVPQRKRMQILDKFSQDKLDILVATDVAARGLHIDKVSHVFNFDLPDDAEDYVHRIGRTGRAGKSGVAISLACERYALNLPDIEEYIQHPISVTDYDPSQLLEDVKTPKVTFKKRSQKGRKYSKEMTRKYSKPKRNS